MGDSRGTHGNAPTASTVADTKSGFLLDGDVIAGLAILQHVHAQERQVWHIPTGKIRDLSIYEASKPFTFRGMTARTHAKLRMPINRVVYCLVGDHAVVGPLIHADQFLSSGGSTQDMVKVPEHERCAFHGTWSRSSPAKHKDWEEHAAKKS